MGLDNPLHIAIILVVVLLLFGARRLPEMGRSLGRGMREFKEEITGEAKHERATLAAATPTATPQPAAPAPAIAQPAPTTPGATPAAPTDAAQPQP